MADDIVSWHLFDVESGQVPEGTSPSILPGGGEGRIVVLAATPFAQSDGWASRATVAIAEDWARKGLRVFLMDLGLETPSLHEVLGLSNDEGVSDAFLYGASVQHIAKPALDDAIFFASAGTAAGDPEEVLGHSRWNDLAGGFSEADATLLLFLPTDIPGSGKILSRATDIIFFSAQGESADAHLGSASVKVVSLLGPLGSPPEEMAPPAEPPDSGEAAVVAAPGAEDLDLGAGEEKDPGESNFDFGGDFELAEGFGEGDLLELEGEDEETAEEASSGEGESTFDLEGGLDLVGDEGAEEEEVVEVEGVEEEADHDLALGSGFTGELELESTAIEEEPEPGPETPPDFGADFVDFPDDDEPGAPVAEEGGDESEFGGDLVQGPDFGGPAPGVEDAVEEGERTAEPTVQEDRVPGQGDEAPVGEEEPEAHRPAPKRRRPPKKKKPVGLYLGLAVILAALVMVGGTAFGFLNVPGLTVLQEYTGSVPDPALTLPGAQPTGPVLRYSLVLFDDYGEGRLSQAAEMMSALKDTRPDLLFLLAPERVEGETIFLLLAGPAATPLDAENLRTPLGEVLTREDPDSWEVRETPRAFYLGERETLEGARDYLASVEAEGLDAYILRTTFDDGSEAFMVMSGAYEGVEDARRLQIILRRSGFLDPPLIERRGIVPE